MEQKKILSFALLSYLLDNKTKKHIGMDLSDVFIPMVEHTLYLTAKDGLNKGSIELIERKFNEEYSFPIPSSIVQNILKRIAQKYNSDCFKIFSDHHFTFEGTNFSELEWKSDKETNNLAELDSEYDQFLIDQNISPDKKVCIFDFISNHSLEMSKVFMGEDCSKEYIGEQFQIAALFINYACSIDKYNEIIKGIYIGSFIAAYIGKSRTVNNQNGFEFILDTSFLLSLLGFNSELSYKRCKKVLDICLEQKFNLTVLNVTINETK
ncbi:MAG: hypothetical protein KKH98_10625, partial [Spirochaetes bacterium]|nr:hypothetical protein [Spirochaetota bacterium]